MALFAALIVAVAVDLPLFIPIACLFPLSINTTLLACCDVVLVVALVVVVVGCAAAGDSGPFSSPFKAISSFKFTYTLNTAHAHTHTQTRYTHKLALSRTQYLCVRAYIVATAAVTVGRSVRSLVS